MKWLHKCIIRIKFQHSAASARVEWGKIGPLCPRGARLPSATMQSCRRLWVLSRRGPNRKENNARDDCVMISETKVRNHQRNNTTAEYNEILIKLQEKWQKTRQKLSQDWAKSGQTKGSLNPSFYMDIYSLRFGYFTHESQIIIAFQGEYINKFCTSHYCHFCV